MSSNFQGNPEWQLPTNQGEDFTVIARIEDIEDKILGGQFSLPIGSQTVKNWHRRTNVGKDARVQAVYCYRRKAVSLTIRGKDNYLGFRKQERPNPSTFRFESEFKPEEELVAGRMNTAKHICDAVQLMIGKGLETSHGFIIVSGGTNSMKSLLARGLIHLFLQRMMETWVKSPETRGPRGSLVAIRRPHLVTCEDDIEKELYSLDSNNRALVEDVYRTDTTINFKQGLWYTAPSLPDYTPRLLGKGKDVDSMAQAVEDALRMTPSVFYAGEIRSRQDWTELWRLAQSHLVVLTTHAASLVNTFSVLQNHLDLKTPSQRSQLANAVVGVVHMRGTIFAEEKSCVIPSGWVRTPMSVAAFTSEGLASIVPKRGKLAEDDDSTYCLGRLAFACHLLEAANCKNDDFRRRMAAWDLRGE